MSPISKHSSIGSISLVLAACLAALAPAGTVSAAEPAGVTLTVQQFELSGNQAIASDVLQPLLKVWTNRQVAQADLARAAQSVTDAYASRGLLARAYLPKQDVTGGVVRIRVQESVFGQIKLIGTVPSAITEQQAKAVVMVGQRQGQIVRLDDLDRALGILAEWPGVRATGDLVKGSLEGQTDLALSLTPAPAASFVIRADNEGARSTGQARLSVNGVWYSPLGLGETFSFNTVLSEGSKNLRLAAEAPVAATGLRAGVYASAMDYLLVSPEFNSLSVKGPSSTVGLSLRWPLARAAVRTTDLSAQLERRSFNNEALGTTLSDYKINAFTANWADQMTDWFKFNARINLDINYTLGNVDLNGSPNQAADALTTRTEGTYHLLRAGVQRLQTLDKGRSWLFKVNGQVASRNLDSSERLPIAGAQGVRAYPIGEISASEGWVVQSELRQNLGVIGQPDFTVALFGDIGFGSQLTDPNFAGAPLNNSLTIKGAGLWFEWRPAAKPVSVRLSWAQRLGDHPNPTALGTNQDGSSGAHRFWLTAQVAL